VNRTFLFRILTGLAAFTLAMMACGPVTTPVPGGTPGGTPQKEPTAIKSEPTKPPELPKQPEPEPTSMSAAKRQQLAKATVRILGLKQQGNRLVPLYNGSGTIITPDGLILTNAHVAQPSSMAMDEFQPDLLGIELVDREDRPPVPSFLGKVLAVDGTLDLAVIKVEKNVDGSPVNIASLNLPFVPLGNSDNVSLGDTMYIFGFPSIGGDTITFTTGNVSGFDRQEKVGERAWFKSDATISGGNSGGQASNVRGELIGVPSRIGTSSALKYTDCRRIQDTNGDGKIDEKDSCIPTGGFINGVRPVNWALPLIQAARTGQTYVSPYGVVRPQPAPTQPPAPQPTQPPGPQPAGTPKFTLIGWAATTDQNNCPSPVVQSFPTGTQKIYAVFQWTGMTPGAPAAWRWYLDNREVASQQENWQYAANGSCFSLSLSNRGAALPDGTYKVDFFAGNNLTQVATASTSIGAKAPAPGPQPTSKGVIIRGQVVDANTRQGLPQTMIVALKPGIDLDQWLQNGTDDDVYTYAMTDNNGNFQLPNAFQRATPYAMMVGNQLGYRPIRGTINLKPETPDVYAVTFQLSK